MLNGNKVLLGLDVSTKCIGVCLLEDDGSKGGKILELTHVNPKIPTKIKDIEKLFLKKKVFEEFLIKYKDFGIDECVIEEPLLSSNNVLVVTTLLRFNGLISECVYNILGIVPEYISSYDARAYSFPQLMSIRKYGKDGKQYSLKKIESEIRRAKVTLFGSYPWAIDKKTVIQEKVSEMFPEIEWIYDSNGELKKENFDASDSYVCAIGQINKKKYGELKFSTDNICKSELDNAIRIDYDVHYWDIVEHRTTYVDKAETEKKQTE